MALNAIRTVAVLGAGTMGARLAAHIANAGFPVLLLDMVPKNHADRNHLAAQALESLKKSKPPTRIHDLYGFLNGTVMSSMT